MKSTTTYLQFRSVAFADLSSVHELHSLPETDEFNTLGIPKSIEETVMVFNAWMDGIAKGLRYIFCIENIEGKFVGIVGITIGKQNYAKGEIWYKIHPDYWGHGYASEAVGCLLAFGFENLNLHRIEAGCSTEHFASQRVLEKNGFQKEGCSRRNLPIRGEWKDNYNFGILVEEWLKKDKK